MPPREDGQFVTQGQFSQVLTLLQELRVERANAVKGELSAFGDRLDQIVDAQKALADSQKELAAHQKTANSKTARLEGTVKLLPCLKGAEVPITCDPDPSGVEVTETGVRVTWRPTKRQVTIGGAVVGGMVSWQALSWLWPYAKAVLEHLVR